MTVFLKRNRPHRLNLRIFKNNGKVFLWQLLRKGLKTLQPLAEVICRLSLPHHTAHVQLRELIRQAGGKWDGMFGLVWTVPRIPAGLLWGKAYSHQLSLKQEHHLCIYICHFITQQFPRALAKPKEIGRSSTYFLGESRETRFEGAMFCYWIHRKITSPYLEFG